MIVASNRGPFRFERNPDGTFSAHRGSGGVVSALMPLLANRDDATWVAAAISEDDRAAVQAGTPTPTGGVHARLIALDPRVSRLHYDVISNGVLWYLHHGLFDLTRQPRFDRRFREAWEGHVDVNRAFTDAVAEVAADGETVLVQDYQLTLMIQMLSHARPDLHLVHFSHTPFCGPSSIRVLPEYVAHAICSSMASGTTGFHTERWARAFRASAREVLGEDAAIGRTFAASFGPDPVAFAAETATPEVDEEIRALEERVGDRQLIVRIDRIEPSKNIVRGFLAYDLLLDEHPELRERVTLAALLNPSRESLPQYLAYRNEVEQAAARVNERWATPGWEPVILDQQDNYSRSLAGLICSDVLLVNPIRDGLNLIALEGPLANRRNGVLCLSREAGAHDQLHHACLTVQPFDIVQTAAALHEALVMDSAERARRAAELRAHSQANPPAAWLDTQLRQAHA
ncbi:MAG: alpha,alpha-trehalose-phosphate synthase (UDP-forming) [Acidimicrobiia bacterium]